MPALVMSKVVTAGSSATSVGAFARIATPVFPVAAGAVFAFVLVVGGAITTPIAPEGTAMLFTPAASDTRVVPPEGALAFCIGEPGGTYVHVSPSPVTVTPMEAEDVFAMTLGLAGLGQSR